MAHPQARQNQTRPAKGRKGWQHWRRASQLLMLAAFIWCLTQMTFVGLAQHPQLTKIFLALDPLPALAACYAALTHLAWKQALTYLLYALPVLVATVLAGRVWCGWICPLGTSIDITDRALFWWKKKPLSVHVHWLKYAVLVLVVVTIFFGSPWLFLFDPIALLTRGITAFAYPLLPHEAGPIPHSGYFALFADAGAGAGIWLVLVLGLGFIGRRFWCRSLCPVGALLGWVSRLAPFSRRAANDCTNCGRCVRKCRGAALADGRTCSREECLVCGDCQALCQVGAVSFGVRAREKSPGSVDFTRRHLLGAAGAGLLLGGFPLLGRLRKPSTSQQTVGKRFLLRPPSALPEAQFLARCERCGACVKACPTGGLQFAAIDEQPWSPVLVPRIGECTPRCTACATVCPTGALQPLTSLQKPQAVIGEAHLDHQSCLRWDNNDKPAQPCTVCVDRCPYAAISMDSAAESARPVVDPSRCVGCGMCERWCPVQPESAIRVARTATTRRGVIFPVLNEQSPEGNEESGCNTPK